MSKPAANHCHVDLCRDKAYRRGVPKLVRGNSLADQGGDLLGRRGRVFLQLEADAGSFERISVPIHEDRLVFSARISFQESLQQFDSLGPERADPLFSAFTEQANLEGRFQTKGLGREIQRLLNTGTGVIEDRQQDMIALAFRFRAVWLCENRGDLVLVEIADFRLRVFLLGIRSTAAHCAAANGSRSATKLKKLCSADNRQFRVPIEDLRTCSMSLRNASTSTSVRSSRPSLATDFVFRAATKRRNSRQLSR